MGIVKKISTHLMMAIALTVFAVSVTGCSTEKENGTDVQQVEDVQNFEKYIKLGSYKHVVDVDMEVTDEEIEQMIDSYLQIYADTANHMKQGTIEKGMLVNMNYTITISDGSESQEDGSGDFIIGSDEIAPGIDMLLIGKETGEICEFEVSFPDDDDKYPGKKGKVKVTINYINSDDATPEADDEFVKKLTNDAFDNIDDFREYLKETRKQNLITQYGQEAISAIIEDSEFIGIEELCKEELESTKHEMYQYGISFELEQNEIWELFGYEDEESFNEYLEQYSTEFVKEKLVVYNLADIYGITVTDEEVAELREMEREYYTDDEIEEQFNESYAKYSILKQKTVETLLQEQ